MATKTQHPPSAFSRVRFGFGPKHPSSRSPPAQPENADDADWYIPYNGPYELPPAAPRPQNRESWGQLLGSVLGNLDSAKASDAGHGWSDERMTGGHITSPLPSSGAYSSHPYRMNAAPGASGTSGSTTMSPQVRGSSSQRLRVDRPALVGTSSTAFANIDATGGVGESPTPVQRSSPLHTAPPSNTFNRLSLASFLTLGSVLRKSRSDSLHAARQSSSGKRSRTGTPPPNPSQSNPAMKPDAAQPSRSHSPLRPGQTTTKPRRRQRSQTLIGTSRSPTHSSSPSHDPSPTSFYTRESPLSSHPYAHTFLPSPVEPPRRAPMIPPSVPRSLDKGKGVDLSHRYPQPPAPGTLNNTEVPAHLKPASRTSLFRTISAPNLRNLSRGLTGSKTSSRGKYRWLSPETWCDALLFPRPRFMAYIDDEPLQSFSHRHTPSTARSPEVPITNAREPHRPPPIILRGSQSAVNLHALPDSANSPGPPRADPILIAQRGSFNADGQSSPGRPRSFAQDDLALLPSPASPVPSLARVLEMGASFDRERAAWKVQASGSLQSSRLTRSLGRSRSQSVGRTRAQLKEMGGVGFLATRTLLGNQLAAPTVHTHTSSDGTQTQQTRSGTSHARTGSSGGHSRAGSKGKAALRAATGLCISNEKMSQEDERNDIPSRNNASRSKSTRIEASAPNPVVGPSPSPPVTSNSDVGLALSSPRPSGEGHSAEAVGPVHVQDQSYAQSIRSTSRRSHAQSGSDYAGPHPSAVSIPVPSVALAITSDMSARHRLPPQAALHPYASPLVQPNVAFLQHSAAVVPPVPPKASHQRRPQTAPENVPSSSSSSAPRNLPRPPQLSDTRETDRGALHAYALGNRFSGAPLAFADALSYGHTRRGSGDSGLGDSENHDDPPASAMQLYTSLPNLVLPPMPENPRPGPDPAHTSTFLSLHSNHTVASSPPETLNPPVFTASVLSYSLHSAQPSVADDALLGSRASSPQQSPRPFSSIEDLDRYRNLFYRPRASGSSGTPSGEHRRMLPRDTGSLTGADTSSNSRISGGSGLTTLTRQLSNELEAIQDMRRLEGAGGGLHHGSQPRMWGLRYGGLRGGDGMGTRTDPNAVLSTTSDSDVNSPEATTLPLSFHQNFGRQSEPSLTIHIPQDVDSRRSSSVLDRPHNEDAHHDELLRVGTVEAAISTPITTNPTHRLSLVGDVIASRSQDSLLQAVALAGHPAMPPSTHLMATTSATSRQGSRSSSLLPPAPTSAATEGLRSSYQTDGTGTSSISGLSEFPAPPSQTVVSPDCVEILKSYFDGERGQSHSRIVPPGETAAGPSRLSSSSRDERYRRPAGDADVLPL